jgi:hypothetical protein
MPFIVTLVPASTGQTALSFLAGGVLSATLSRLLRASHAHARPARELIDRPEQPGRPNSSARRWVDVPGSARRNVRGPGAKRLAIPFVALPPRENTEAAVDCAESFVTQLSALPAPAWASVGQSIARETAREREARLAARARLTSLIADRGLRVTAWRIADAVDTVSFLAVDGMRRTSPSRTNRALHDARRAAQDLALACLARPFLSAADLGMMLAPFAAVMSGHDAATGELVIELPRTAAGQAR